MITEVPFRLAGAAQPLILVPTSVNGRGPFDFILDTGAGTSLVSLDLARQQGIPTEQMKEGTGAGGKVRLALGTVESLAVGQARREHDEYPTAEAARGKFGAGHRLFV